jgi:hypothetical protein
MFVCLLNTNKMHFSFLIYFNNLSSTRFEHRNYSSSLIKPVYHDARSTEWVKTRNVSVKFRTFIQQQQNVVSNSRISFLFWYYFKFVGVLSQHSAQRDAIRPINTYKPYFRKARNDCLDGDKEQRRVIDPGNKCKAKHKLTVAYQYAASPQ